MDSTLRLIIEKGPREGETLEFKPGNVIRLGRVIKGNTLAIKEAGISSKHLLIQFVPEKSQWFVSDLDSSNGTILNGNQLTPTVPAHLSDGDTIKLGELTSIKVQIETTLTSQCRRNPKRGVAGKRGKQEVKSELYFQNSELRLDDDKQQKAKAVEMPPRGPGRGRSKKEAVSEENHESSCKVVVQGEELSNVGLVLPKRGRQVCTRRTRSSKQEENLVSDSITGDTLKESSKDESNLREELVPANPRTRGRGRGKRNLQVDEQLEELGEECSKASEKNSPNKDNIRHGLLETLDEECAKGPAQSSPAKETKGHKLLADSCDEHVEALENNSPVKETKGHKQLADSCDEHEALEKNSPVKETKGHKQLVDSCDEYVEALEKNSTAKDNLEAAKKVEKLDKPCAKESEKKSNAEQEGIKNSGVDVGESPNLENMTLGDWFDYLEIALPKEIYAATEEMIAGMRKKAEQFHEFMLQQNKAKAKAPME